MTINAKDGASTVNASAKEAETNAKVRVHREENDAPAPPAYTENADSTSLQQGSKPSAPPCNLVGISSDYGSVKGTWVVNTDLSIPEALLPPLSTLGDPKERPNLHLSSAYGDVKATISLACSTTNKPPKAKINVNTKHGSVEGHVLSRENQQHFSLVAFSSYGNMKITIPRDYVGPLKCVTGWGKTRYSKGVEANLLTISKDMAFVGDLGRSGFVDFESWKEDEIDVQTKYGDIYVQYADEYAIEEGKTLRERIAEWAGFR